MGLYEAFLPLAVIVALVCAQEIAERISAWQFRRDCRRAGLDV